jgi:hypothetical protein
MALILSPLPITKKNADTFTGGNTNFDFISKINGQSIEDT